MRASAKQKALPFTKQDIDDLDALLSPDRLDLVLYPFEERQGNSLLAQGSAASHPLHEDYIPPPTLGTLLGKPRHDERTLSLLRSNQASRIAELEQTIKSGTVYRHISQLPNYHKAEHLFNSRLTRRGGLYAVEDAKLHFLRISLLNIGRFLSTNGREFKPRHPTTKQAKAAQARIYHLLKRDFSHLGVSLQSREKQNNLLRLLLDLYQELSDPDRKPSEGKEACHAEFVRHVSADLHIAFGEASEKLVEHLAFSIGTGSAPRTISRWREAGIEMRLANSLRQN